MSVELPTTLRFSCPSCGYDKTWHGRYDAGSQSLRVEHTHTGSPPHLHPGFTDAWIEDPPPVPGSSDRTEGE